MKAKLRGHKRLPLAGGAIDDVRGST